MSGVETGTLTPVRAHTRTKAKRPYVKTSARRQGVRLTKEQKERAQGIFLTSFSRMANVTAACIEAGISRETFYQWQKEEKFARRYEEADQSACDMVRAAIYQRGVNGWLEPVVSRGEIVRNEDGTPFMIRRYSDALTLALAKARLPEYRERVEVSATLDITTLAAEADAKFAAYLSSVTAPKLLGEPHATTEGGA